MNADFISAVQELGKEKGIDPEMLFTAVEEALVAAYKKNYGSNQNVRVDMNKKNGEIHVFAQRVVVEGPTQEFGEISLDDARAIDERYELEDIVEVEVTPRNFGRIAAQNAKQVVVQRIREAERGMVYERFSGREQDIVTGTIQRMEAGNVYIDLGKVEAVLALKEQIPGEVYQYHERMKTYIVEVKRTSKGPQIMVSRTHPGLLKRLFELEVPEIQDGVVEIKSVSREPGMRSKISVYTADPRKNKKAKFFKEITFLDAISKQLRVMDLSALTLCLENNIDIYVFDVLAPNNIVKTFKKQSKFTHIHK